MSSTHAVEGHCLQAMKIVHHHANGRSDWLISEHQNVNLTREAISINIKDLHPSCSILMKSRLYTPSHFGNYFVNKKSMPLQIESSILSSKNICKNS